MRELLTQDSALSFLDETAQRFVREARSTYKRLELDTRLMCDLGSQIMVMTWLGDAANEAIACLLNLRGFKAWPAGPGVEILKGSATEEDIEAALVDAGMDEAPSLDVLFAEAKNLERQTEVGLDATHCIAAPSLCEPLPRSRRSNSLVGQTLEMSSVMEQ